MGVRADKWERPRTCECCLFKKRTADFEPYARACLSCAPSGFRWCRRGRHCPPIADFGSFQRGGKTVSYSDCRDCRNASARKFKRDTPIETRRERSKRYFDRHRETCLARSREYAKRPASRAQRLMRDVVERCRLRGVPVENTKDFRDRIQDVIDHGFCEVTGLPFLFETGRGPFVPSLDRIVPKRGYVPGNVRVVCLAFNTMVGDWGDDVAAQVAEAFLAKRATAGLSISPSLRTFRPSPVVTFGVAPFAPPPELPPNPPAVYSGG
jgi:hypothetical protein